MFFLKSKSKSDELLPPPPPEAEFDEQSKKDTQETKFFEETTKPEETTETFTEEKEIGDLAKDLNMGLEPQKEVSKKEKTSQKSKVTKKQKIPKKMGLKKPVSIKTTKDKSLQSKKRIPIKQIKEEKMILKKPIKIIKREVKKEKLEDLDFILPKESEETSNEEMELPEPKTSEEFELPETLEDFGKDSKQEKPTEILEAEEEIKSAIEKIKKQERPSLFKRLFSRKEKVQKKPIEEHLMTELSEAGGVSTIQNNINKARESLIRFDLETAKKNYIEIMKIYNTIKPEEQSKVYHDIKELYFERKSAEGLKA